MICPKCGGKIARIDSVTFVCESCGARFVKRAPKEQTQTEQPKAPPSKPEQPKVEPQKTENQRVVQPQQEQPRVILPKTESPKTAEQVKVEKPKEEKNESSEIELLKARLAEMEKKQADLEKAAKAPASTSQKKPLANFKKTKFYKFLGDKGLKVVLPCVVLLVTAITLMVCFIGVRGVYYNTENPNEFISFTATNYEWHSFEYGDEYVEKGTWKIKDGKLYLTCEDELFGKMTAEYYIAKKDGNKTLMIGDQADDLSEYNRAQVTSYKGASGKKINVTFDANGGEGGENYKITIGSVLEDIPTATREGYIFDGWYFEKETEDWTTVTSPKVNVRLWKSATYYAKWKCDGNHTLQNCKCTKCGETIHTLNRCRCTKCNAIYHTPDENCICTVCGVFDETAVAEALKSASYVRHNGTIYFGSYPQTKVTDDSTRATLNGKAGDLPTSTDSKNWTSYEYYIEGDNSTDYMWYIDIEHGGEKYRGVYFTSYRPYRYNLSSVSYYAYQDDNGYEVSTVYWFKYEPIEWRILAEYDGIALIMANLALDSQQYYHDAYEGRQNRNGNYVYANNYAESDIRAWLNDNFYNTAFSALEKALIEITEVDNSVESTGDRIKDKVCENTNDNIFLLSYQEATTFLTKTNSQFKRTDYAESQGCYTANYLYKSNCHWWLRSPSLVDDKTQEVNYDGITTYNYVNNTCYGVVPVLTIKLS